MIVIDGSYGEGGGQILRTSLSLSLITGKAFTIENIRAGRKKPGLRKQHVTCVRAASRIGSARIEGAKEGSNRLVFEPQTNTPGNYRFVMGSAGSTTLVLQSILPALLTASGPSTIVVEGGTHNPYAPPYPFLSRVYMPLLRRMGARVELTLHKAGFYPNGGGKIEAVITPVEELRRLDILERGSLVEARGTALVSRLPKNIGEREISVLRRKLSIPAKSLKVQEVASKGPGNVVFVEYEYDRLTELFIGFGEKGVKAEKVADAVVKQSKRYLQTDAPVGEYLADQLLLLYALAGSGQFRTVTLSDHSLTNIDTIRKFVDFDVRVEREGLTDLVTVG